MSRKPYVREVPKTTWYFRQGRYMRYMGREVTCIFVGAYALFLLVAIKRLSEGRAAYEAFLEGLSSPAGILFQVVTLIFVLYHATSWFNLTPKAMPIQRGEQFLPGGVIVGAHYAGWVVVSLVVLILAGVF
ncbi:MAG: fumarate reductase subunit C [Gammaproteobacteria bacterium]|jgi:fumarate reductase subunit C